MRKRWRWATVGLVGLVGLGTCGLCCVQFPTPARVERRIRTDVPVGTPRAAVEDYLRGRGIPFAAEDREIWDGQMVREAGLRDGEIKRFIYATVEPAFVDLSPGGTVQVFFLFDGADRLIGYALRAWADYP